MPRLATTIAIALSCAIASITEGARASCESGGAVTHDCQLDLVTGPVLASNRVVGLGGAYQALADGLGGYTQNAAAPAVRDPWSYKWFGWEVDASISFPSAFRNIDFENRGQVSEFTYNDFIFLTLGANVQLGAWGFGFFTDLQRYNLTPNVGADQPSYAAVVSKTHALIARQFFDGDLVIGAGARIVGFSITQSKSTIDNASVVSLSGAAPEIGALFKPANEPYRIGMTFRAPVHTGDPGPGDATSVNGLILPGHANLPWELDTGIAVQAGAREANDPWINPHDEERDLREEIKLARLRRAEERESTVASAPPQERAAKLRELDDVDRARRAEEERELDDFTRDFESVRKARFQAMPREYLLFTFGLLVVGPTEDGISLESFFRQKIARAGKLTTFSPRAGLETELVPEVVKLRLGAYVEPTRFGSEPDSRAFRQHVTGGFDLYLFKWTVFGIFDEGTAWRLTTGLDVAPRYSNYGLSLGVWH